MKKNTIQKEVVEIIAKELPQTKIQKTSLDLLKQVSQVSENPSYIESTSKLAVAKQRISEMASIKRFSSKIQPVTDEKILEFISTPSLIKLSSSTTKSSQFNNTSRSAIKEPRDEDITEYSSEYLKKLIELKKHSYVPEKLLNTPQEKVYVEYMQNYVIEFKNSILNSDVEIFEEIFKNCLENPMLYQVSGYPIHLMSDVFKLVVSTNLSNYKDKIEFSAKYLSDLVGTKNDSNVDTSCIKDITITHAKSFLQGMEISIAKARSSDINDSSKQLVMTNDEPKSILFMEKIKEYYLLVGSRQSNYDLTQLDQETKGHTPKDIKISGKEKTDLVSHQTKNNIIYVGNINRQDLITMKQNQVHKQIVTVKESLDNPNISVIKKKWYQEIKQLLHEYENAKTPVEQIPIFHKLESKGYRMNNIVSCDSFVPENEK